MLSITGSLASTVGQANPFRYRGYYYDSETGLYYLQTRYYDPEVGRFLNADYYASTGKGILCNNMFAYCENNPIMRSDSTGRWFGLDDLIAGLVGAVVGVVTQFCSDVVTSFVTWSWQFSSWETYVGDAIGGAVGGITSLYAGPTVGCAIGSGLSTLLGQTFENCTGKQNRSATEIMVNSFVDASIGAVMTEFASIKAKGITSGRNSMQAVFKSGLTKLGNKTASKMSAKVIGYGIVSGLVANASNAVVKTTKDLIIKSTPHKLNHSPINLSGQYYYSSYAP